MTFTTLFIVLHLFWMHMLLNTRGPLWEFHFSRQLFWFGQGGPERWRPEGSMLEMVRDSFGRAGPIVGAQKGQRSKW
jgi:hypothetical protein